MEERVDDETPLSPLDTRPQRRAREAGMKMSLRTGIAER